MTMNCRGRHCDRDEGTGGPADAHRKREAVRRRRRSEAESGADDEPGLFEGLFFRIRDDDRSDEGGTD
jgi:hypothetical protein